jgi:hypothetical protein
MSRIFTFGCSFTQYCWPTWADIIAYDQGIEYCNYALAGLGNVGIFHRLLEADLIHKFKDDDQIYILWSSWSREDRIKDGNWLPNGSVLNPGSAGYDKRFIKKYWDSDNDAVKNSTAIICANRLYNVSWQATGFRLFVDEDRVVKTPNQKMFQLYSTAFPTMKFLKIEDHKTPAFGTVEGDFHPDVLKHLEIAETIYSDVGRLIKDSTKETFTKIHNDIKAIAQKNKNFDKLIPAINVLLSQEYPTVFETVNVRSFGE